MGSNRKLLFGVLLVVAGLVVWGILGVIKGINNRVTPTPPPVATAPQPKPRGLVAYANQDIPAGSIVTKELFEMRQLPGGGPTTAFVTNPEAQAIGYITRVAIPKGGLLRPEGDFVGHISQVGIAGALRPGTRAMVIPFANKPTLHDLVRIGNYVDVNAAFDGQESRTIVEGVRVLAVDVFGNDYPQVNVAVRGPYKADPVGSGIASVPTAPGANGVVPGPDATPTPTPAPAQAPARPDPALTLEVTPTQANTILLAQSSGGTLDFVVRPALPGGRDADPILVNGGAEPGATPGPNGVVSSSGLRAVSVTRAQIAPYAERKKSANSGGSVRNVSTSGGSSNGGGGGGRRGASFSPLPLPDLPSPTGSGLGTSVTPVTDFPPTSSGPAPAAPSATYDIPIYADGKTVRVETVRRPQE